MLCTKEPIWQGKNSKKRSLCFFWIPILRLRSGMAFCLCLWGPRGLKPNSDEKADRIWSSWRLI